MSAIDEMGGILDRLEAVQAAMMEFQAESAERIEPLKAAQKVAGKIQG